MRIKLIAIPEEAHLPSYFKIGEMYEVVDTIYDFPIIENPTNGARFGIVHEMYEVVES